MSADNISFSMSADEKDVTRALQNLIKENAKLRAEMTKGVDESKQGAKGAAEAQRLHSQAVKDATQIAEKYATGEEKLAAKLARVNDLRAKGVLSSKDYGLALTGIRKEHDQLIVSQTAVADSGDRFNTTLATMGSLGIGAIAFLQQMAAKLSELRTEMAADVVGFDKLSRKLGIQGGLSPAERKAQSQMVGKIALDAAVPIDKAFETATQLSSSGFADPVKNGTLNTALALMQSSNQIEGDAAGFIKGSGQFMQAFGMKKDQQNLADLGIRMQGLFKGTDVQAADLPEFAKAAPVLSGAGMTLEQSLSTMTALRETMNAGEAATGARNIVSILQTSGANNTASSALGKIGLSPQQVDIQGEGLKGALEALKHATDKLGEADRATTLAQIFGRENAAAASILMNSTGKFDQYAQMQRGAAIGFQADVTTARSGAFAEATRSDVSKQIASVSHEDFVQQQELMRNARVNLRTEAAKRDFAKGTFGGKFDATVRGIRGWTEDTFVAPLTGERVLGTRHKKEMERLSNSGPGAVQVNVQMPDELRAALNENNKLLQKQVEAQNENNKLLQKQVEAQKSGAHAGVVAGRRDAQMEGAR